MGATSFLALAGWGAWFGSPLTWLATAFQFWMMVDAVRQREWGWLVLMVVAPGFGACWYFLQVYLGSPSATRGFELPGAHDRRRIKQLQAQIHHLDKAHHHSQLGDIYFQQGKLALAEASYRAALERDPKDLDTRAHLGQTLLRSKRPQEARPLLEGVCQEDPKHEYGYSLMALAETLAALGEVDSAVGVLQRVTENHSYPRAKVQLAELFFTQGQPDRARAEVQEVLADDPHAPGFQRRRDRVWIQRAKRLLRRLG